VGVCEWVLNDAEQASASRVTEGGVDFVSRMEAAAASSVKCRADVLNECAVALRQNVRETWRFFTEKNRCVFSELGIVTQYSKCNKILSVEMGVNLISHYFRACSCLTVADKTGRVDLLLRSSSGV
jgi:hypothetical protein